MRLKLLFWQPHNLVENRHSTNISKYLSFPLQTAVNGRSIGSHLPVKPVICVAGVRVGIITAEVVAGLGILQNTKTFSDLAERQTCRAKWDTLQELRVISNLCSLLQSLRCIWMLVPVVLHISHTRKPGKRRSLGCKTSVSIALPQWLSMMCCETSGYF